MQSGLGLLFSQKNGESGSDREKKQIEMEVFSSSSFPRSKPSSVIMALFSSPQLEDDQRQQALLLQELLRHYSGDSSLGDEEPQQGDLLNKVDKVLTIFFLI